MLAVLHPLLLLVLLSQESNSELSYNSFNESLTYFQSLTDYLVHHEPTTPQECFDLLRPRTLISNFHDQDGPLWEKKELNYFMLRCVRGEPFSSSSSFSSFSSSSSSSSSSPSSSSYYLAEQLSFIKSESQNFSDEMNSLTVNSINKQFNLDRIDNRNKSPYFIRGKGSFYITTIHQIEHYAEQLEYLVNANLLPYQFLEIVFEIRYVIVFEMAKNINQGVDCGYSTASKLAHSCDSFLRRTPYVLSGRMTEQLMGTNNRLVHMPVQVPRSLKHPHALNQNLDFDQIEESFLRGEVSERSERA